MGHGSHSSHSSHSVHSNSDSHSNTLSNMTVARSSANEHTATIGGVDWSSSFNYDTTPLGTYGGTGSLTKLKGIIDSMRARVTDANYTDNPSSQRASSSGSIPSISTTDAVKITTADVSNMVTYGGSSYDDRYQPYTLTLAANCSGKVTANSVTGSKTQSIDGSKNTSTKSWTATATGTAGTSKSYTCTDNLDGAKVKGASSASSSVSLPAAGSKITKANAEAILTALENETVGTWKGPASKSFTWSGNNTVNHANTHSSHSSHSN